MFAPQASRAVSETSCDFSCVPSPLPITGRALDLLVDEGLGDMKTLTLLFLGDGSARGQAMKSTTQHLLAAKQ